MKKIFVYSILLFVIYPISNNLFAQTEKGTWLLGGSANFSNEFTNDDFRMNIAPNLGYFVINDLSIGAEVPFSLSRTDNVGSSTLSSSSLGIVPSVRYYLNLTEKIKILLNAFGGLRFSRFRSEGTPSFSSNRTFIQLGGRSGLAFFLNRHVALETTLNYLHFREAGSRDSFPENLISLNIGLQIHFAKGNKE